MTTPGDVRRTEAVASFTFHEKHEDKFGEAIWQIPAVILPPSCLLRVAWARLVAKC